MNNKNNLLKFKVEKNKIYETGEKEKQYPTPSFANYTFKGEKVALCQIQN